MGSVSIAWRSEKGIKMIYKPFWRQILILYWFQYEKTDRILKRLKYYYCCTIFILSKYKRRNSVYPLEEMIPHRSPQILAWFSLRLMLSLMKLATSEICSMALCNKGRSGWSCSVFLSIPSRRSLYLPAQYQMPLLTWVYFVDQNKISQKKLGNLSDNWQRLNSGNERSIKKTYPL